MTDTKTTARRTRAKKAANSPMPSGPGGALCGHSGCGDQCAVRYVGPTSHLRDHLLHRAAHGAGQVWTAAIVAGLAVVLTASIAFAATQAETAPKVKNLNEAVAAIWRKLDNIEKLLKQQQQDGGQQMGGQGGMMKPPGNGSESGTGMMPNKQPGGTLNTETMACATKCKTAADACIQSATDETAKKACGSTADTCLRACGLTPPTMQPGGPQGGQQGGQQGGGMPQGQPGNDIQ